MAQWLNQIAGLLRGLQRARAMQLDFTDDDDDDFSCPVCHDRTSGFLFFWGPTGVY